MAFSEAARSDAGSGPRGRSDAAPHVPFSLKLFDPRLPFSFLAALLLPLRFLWRLVWPAAILACCAAAFNWYQLVDHLDRVMLTFSFLQNLLLGLFSANLSAKLAQGITMNWCGGQSREFGIRLAFGFLPRFYIEHQAIRGMSFRNQRACYAAPLLARLSVFAGGILGWTMLHRSAPGLSELLLAVGGVGFGAFLFNANPLWPADGYHWVAAATQRPKLRPHAMQVLWMTVTRRPIPPDLPRREYWLLMSYALASIVFTAVIVYLVLTAIAFALEERFRGTGVFIFCLLLVSVGTFLLSVRANRKRRRGGAAAGPRQGAAKRPASPQPALAANAQSYLRISSPEVVSESQEQMASNSSRVARRADRAGRPGPVRGGEAEPPADDAATGSEALSELLADEAVWSGPGEDPDWDLAHPSDWDHEEEEAPAAAGDAPMDATLDDILGTSTAPARFSGTPLAAAVAAARSQRSLAERAAERAAARGSRLPDPPEAEGGASSEELDAILAAFEEPQPDPTPAVEDDDDLMGLLADAEEPAPAPDPAAPSATRPDPGAAAAPDPAARRAQPSPSPAAAAAASVPAPAPPRQAPVPAAPRRGAVSPQMRELDSVLRTGHARPSRWRIWLARLFWVAALAVAVWVAMLPYPFEVGGDFIVQPLDRIEVRARTAGEIVSVAVNEGDWVEQGDMLAQLSDWDLRRDIAVREAEIARQEAELATLVAGSTPEQIAVAQQGVAGAEVAVEVSARDLARQEALFASGAVSQKAVEDARSANQLAIAERDRAAANLAEVRSEARQSEIAAQQADIDGNRQELSYLQRLLEETKIRAPVDGRIAGSLSTVPVGAFLPEGGLFAELEDNRVVMVEIEVPETDIEEVEIGASAELRLWSAPDEPLAGTVRSIAPRAEERDFGQIIRVKVEVPNPDGRLAGNMTGFGKIEAAERPVWQAFGRVIERFFRVELWSWLP